MNKLITGVADYIRADWAENKIRTVLEVTAWITSMCCAIAVAITVPDVPWLIIYPLFISHCAMFAYCAWTRGSTGMIANYLVLCTVDTIGLTKLIWITYG